MAQNKSSNAKNGSKNIVKKIALGSLVVLLLFIAWLLWAFLPGSTKKLEAIGNQFKPEPSWTLVTEQVNPPFNICIGAQCNQLNKRWSVGSTIDPDVFYDAISKSGWQDDLKITEKCDTAESNSTGSGSTQCEAIGTIEDYEINIRAVTSYTETNGSDIILSIEGHKNNE